LFDRPKPTMGCSASGRRRGRSDDIYVTEVSVSGPKMSQPSPRDISLGYSLQAS